MFWAIPCNPGTLRTRQAVLDWSYFLRSDQGGRNDWGVSPVWDQPRTLGHLARHGLPGLPTSIGHPDRMVQVCPGILFIVCPHSLNALQMGGSSRMVGIVYRPSETLRFKRGQPRTTQPGHPGSLSDALHARGRPKGVSTEGV